MVLSVNLELFNPLNQKKEGVCENIPYELLTNLLFFCLQPLWFVASYFTAYLFFFGEGIEKGDDRLFRYSPKDSYRSSSNPNYTCCVWGGGTDHDWANHIKHTAFSCHNRINSKNDASSKTALKLLFFLHSNPIAKQKQGQDAKVES